VGTSHHGGSVIDWAGIGAGARSIADSGQENRRAVVREEMALIRIETTNVRRLPNVDSHAQKRI
jgi:hypothetical protein